MSTYVHWVWLTNACTRNDGILGLYRKVQMHPVRRMALAAAFHISCTRRISPRDRRMYGLRLELC
jgi:hypothetical protein